MDEEEDYESLSGMLWKWGGSVVKRHQERWFELREGKLYYYAGKPLGRVDLAGCKVESVQGSSSAWCISGPHLRHSYTLKGENDGTKAIWMARLRQAIQKRSGGRRGSFDSTVSAGCSEADPRGSGDALPVPEHTPTFTDGPLPFKLKEDSKAPAKGGHRREASVISIHREESDCERSKPPTPHPPAVPADTLAELERLREQVKDLLAKNEQLLRQSSAAGGADAPPSASNPASALDGDSDTETGTVVVRDEALTTPRGTRTDDPYATFAYMERQALSPGRQSGSGEPVSPDSDKQNEVLERMKKQLYFEREEQRSLREDLCQEIDRLKEELRAAYARMQTAEDQAQDLLARAMAHKKGELSTPRGPRPPAMWGAASEDRRLSQPPSEEESPATHAINRSHRSLSINTHARARSHDFGASDRLKRDHDGVVSHVAESHLQSKLEQQMVAKYIELKKVLHELQDIGIERVEHVVHVRKQSESEDVGFTFKKGPRHAVIRSVRGAAYRAKIKPGMIIMSVDGVSTPTPDAVVAAFAKYATDFDVVVTEPLTELVARVEGNSLLAEERDAILRENDRLKQQAASIRCGYQGSFDHR
eukprot:TRINITY_DN18282_c0_g1_i1.p1 TRINITY_DN18282_c0_g1~~TRINITY_DN18282_c0_g1_i1.p1  ORF type:complete len:593 (+),score=211.08 TRINITY_DN18282_c0_g1_i1:103-1881(+)